MLSSGDGQRKKQELAQVSKARNASTMGDLGVNALLCILVAYSHLMQRWQQKFEVMSYNPT